MMPEAKGAQADAAVQATDYQAQIFRTKECMVGRSVKVPLAADPACRASHGGTHEGPQSYQKK